MTKTNVFSKIIDFFKKVKKIADEDSLRGYIVSIILIVIVIKLLVLPGLGLILGNTSYPIVSVVSNSMEHKPNQNDEMCNQFVLKSEYKNSFENWWDICGDFYPNNHNISKQEFELFPMKNGFNIGDAMIVYKKDPEDIEKGDILIFMMTIQQNNKIIQKPVIHRVIDIKQENNEFLYTTKGDWNFASDYREKDISYDQVQGVAIIKIPFLGYPKYLLSKLLGQL